jgi:hypothetical protein
MKLLLKQDIIQWKLLGKKDSFLMLDVDLMVIFISFSCMGQGFHHPPSYGIFCISMKLNRFT